MRVAVLGAGVAGLVAAYRLTQAGHVCDVYERWPGLGGQAATLDVGGGDLLERYYHHLFTSDRHIVALYEELGMGDELEWKPSSMAFFLEGRQWAFTSPLDLLRFGPLSPPARLRMGLAVFLLQKRAKAVGPFESITAREWIESRMGRAPWRKVWGPLLRGKFGTRADDISMAWLWSKLTLRRQLEGDEAKQELLGYPAHSWELLFDALRDAIVAGGGRVLIDRPAAGLRRGRRGRGRPLRRHGGRGRARFAPATTRAASARARRRRRGALRRGRRHRPQRRLRRAARRRPGRRDRAGVPRPPRRRRVPHGAVPAARARPPVLAVLLDEHRRSRAAVRRPRRAHELHLARALRRPALPLRRQLPRARRPAARPGHRRAARRLPARPAQGLAGLLDGLDQGPLAAPRAGRPADRHRRLPPPHPAAADRRAGVGARQHHADLSRGPRDELQRAAGNRRGAVFIGHITPGVPVCGRTSGIGLPAV